jgi:hypothetical protein
MTNDATRIFHPWRIAASLLCLLWVLALLSDTAHAMMRDWPDWTKTLAVVSLPFSTLGFVLLLNGVGLIRSSWMSSVGQNRAPTAETFMAVYVGSMIAVAGIAVLLVWALHVDWLRACYAGAGAVFLLASSRRPWWLFATFRRVGWFTLIERDAAMRWLLGVIGAAFLLISSIFGRGRPGEQSMPALSPAHDSSWAMRTLLDTLHAHPGVLIDSAGNRSPLAITWKVVEFRRETLGYLIAATMAEPHVDGPSWFRVRLEGTVIQVPGRSILQ